MSLHAWSRRRVIASALAAATLPSAHHAFAAGHERAPVGERWIELRNTHTGERVNVVFRNPAGYVPEALSALSHLLRDHRADEAHPMDPALYDLLGDLARAARREPRYEIISGYRSPATNARLQAQGRGVATRSLHMQGRALDVRLEDCPCAELRDLALAMRRGGVGFYPRSDFVHLDTGRVRSWQG